MQPFFMFSGSTNPRLSLPGYGLIDEVIIRFHGPTVAAITRFHGSTVGGPEASYRSKNLFYKIDWDSTFCKQLQFID